MDIASLLYSSVLATRGLYNTDITVILYRFSAPQYGSNIQSFFTENKEDIPDIGHHPLQGKLSSLDKRLQVVWSLSLRPFKGYSTQASGVMEEDSKVEPEPVAGTSTEWTSSTEWTLPEWTSAAEAEPDNSQVDDSPETFEVTAQGLKDLMKSMEKMLSDVEELRSQCSDQAKELLEAAVDLKQQQDELKESYKELAAEMEEIMEALDDICITKSASEAREKEAEKLNKQF